MNLKEYGNNLSAWFQNTSDTFNSLLTIFTAIAIFSYPAIIMRFINKRMSHEKQAVDIDEVFE